MKIEITTDMELVKKFLTQDDELWFRITEDFSHKDDFNPISASGIYWIKVSNNQDELMAIMYIHQSTTACYNFHVNILKKYRSTYGKKILLSWLDWYINDFKDAKHKLILEIPDCFRYLCLYSEMFGFKYEGTNRECYLKNGQLMDRHLMGATVTEIKRLFEEKH